MNYVSDWTDMLVWDYYDMLLWEFLIWKFDSSIFFSDTFYELYVI